MQSIWIALIVAGVIPWMWQHLAGPLTVTFVVSMS
jgi:hypothetical protein